MTTLRQIVDVLGLRVAAGANSLGNEVTAGYASDLLSCVMGHARKGSVWVTLQSHINVVAVASVAELSGIIVTEGAAPDAATIAKADDEGIPLLLTPKSTFAVVADLVGLGVHGTE
jgi:hypothetical protein